MTRQTVDTREARDEGLQGFAYLEVACRALSEANTHLRRSAESGGSCSQERADVLTAWQKAQDAMLAIGHKVGTLT